MTDREERKVTADQRLDGPPVMTVITVSDRLSAASLCLVGLVVKASISRAEDPGFESHSRRDVSGVESYQ